LTQGKTLQVGGTCSNGAAAGVNGYGLWCFLPLHSANTKKVKLNRPGLGFNWVSATNSGNVLGQLAFRPTQEERFLYNLKMTDHSTS